MSQILQKISLEEEMVTVWQTLENVVLPGYSSIWDTTVQLPQKGTRGIGMRGEEVGLAIKEAIKTIALRGDVRKVTVMLNACLIHLLQFVCDVCVCVHPSVLTSTKTCLHTYVMRTTIVTRTNTWSS